MTMNFDELERLRERADKAIEWLDTRVTFEDAKEALAAQNDAQVVISAYIMALRAAAPELIRLARTGAAMEGMLAKL